ncbi:MAG: cbb3-type cytochrome oxidase assembly protein CcoS [Rhodospirillales bacterium]
MEMVSFLIPVALLLGLLGLGAFFWSIRSGQFDDPEGAANRVLLDDDEIGGKTSEPDAKADSQSDEGERATR